MLCYGDVGVEGNAVLWVMLWNANHQIGGPNPATDINHCRSVIHKLSFQFTLHNH